MLLSTEVTRLALAVNVVAWPVAYLAVNAWLDGIAYHVDPGIGVFAAGALVGLVIAWITVGYHAARRFG